MTRAAIYARISLDRQDGAGVGRQVDDCRRKAAELDWEVVGEYVDNDVSAFSGKARPEYRRMLADIQAGTIEGVIAYHSNRLYRLTKELTEFVDVVTAARCAVDTVASGHFDLTTAAGRKRARDAGSDAQYESEVLGERVSRERRERAAQGKPGAGGMRPFGYEPDKVTIVPEEADLIRAAAERVAAGGSIWSEVLGWNDAGMRTTTGKPWIVSALRRVLTSPRIAGLRTYKGEVVGPATWPAIIDRETHERIVAMAQSRKRGRPSKRWLLSGMIACPYCSRPLYGSSSGAGAVQYSCAPAPFTERCGGSAITARHADDKVCSLVRGWLVDPPKGMRSWLAASAADPVPEITKIKDRRAELAKQFALGNLTADDFAGAIEVLNKRESDLEMDIPRVGKVPPADVLLTAWDAGDILDRRAIIETWVQTPMQLAPGKIPNPGDRLTVLPVWA